MLLKSVHNERVGDTFFTTSSTVPKLLAKRFTEIVREQMKFRDSGAVHCEDVLQFVLNSRKKFGTHL